MRNLTIQRTKTMVGCFSTMQVYVEAPDWEIKIDGVFCRKLGTLKNGEKKTFQVSEGRCRIYVISDQLSKSYSNDFYQLEEGSEDLVLTGRNRYNLTNGHAFQFDGNDSQEATNHRKKNKTIGTIVLIIALLVGVGLGLVRNMDFAKTFTHQEMSITLTTDFQQRQRDDYDAYYASKYVVVPCLREAFSLAEGFSNLTLMEYGNLVMENNGITSQIQTVYEITYFDYQWVHPESGQVFYYFATVHKTEDAFWLIQFATPLSNKDNYLPDFLKWARSISFS